MKILNRNVQRYSARPMLSAALLCGPLMLPHVVLAASSYFELDPEQLLSAQAVSVSKHMESVAESPAAIYVVTNEDIRRSGVTNIPDALRMVPGVNVAQNDSNTWAVSIRGFNNSLANKLLVMIDGRTIYNPVFGGTFWEAHNLPMSDIDRIEVVRGPGNALWGANAVNGVINIITKSAQDTTGNLVGGILGDEERGTIGARHGGKLADDAFYRVYAKAFKKDSSQALTGEQAYDSWDGMRSGFRMDWVDVFTLQGDIYRNQTQQRRANFALTSPYAPLENQTLVYSGANILGRYTHRYADGALLNVQSYIDWTERDEPINFLDQRTIYDLEAQYNFAVTGAQQWTLGAGVRYLSDDKVSQSRNASFTPQSSQDVISQIFIQDKYTLIEDTLYTTLGLKAEHTEVSGLDVQPNTRLQWHIKDDLSIWLAASRAVRTPTPFERGLTTTLESQPGVIAALVPNEYFESEELTAYEFGYRHQMTETLFTDLTTFYNDYKKLQSYQMRTPELIANSTDPVHVFVPYQFTNDATGVSRGFEVVLGWSVNPDIKFTATYSHFELDLDTVDARQESLEGANPVDQVGLRMFCNIVSGWTVDTSAYYVSALPFGEVDSYVRLDINLGGCITPELRFNLTAQNLLDSSHEELKQINDANSAEIERSIFGKLIWEF